MKIHKLALLDNIKIAGNPGIKNMVCLTLLAVT